MARTYNFAGESVLNLLDTSGTFISGGFGIAPEYGIQPLRDPYTASSDYRQSTTHSQSGLYTDRSSAFGGTDTYGRPDRRATDYSRPSEKSSVQQMADAVRLSQDAYNTSSVSRTHKDVDVLRAEEALFGTGGSGTGHSRQGNVMHHTDTYHTPYDRSMTGDINLYTHDELMSTSGRGDGGDLWGRSSANVYPRNDNIYPRNDMNVDAAAELLFSGNKPIQQDPIHTGFGGPGRTGGAGSNAAADALFGGGAGSLEPTNQAADILFGPQGYQSGAFNRPDPASVLFSNNEHVTGGYQGSDIIGSSTFGQYVKPLRPATAPSNFLNQQGRFIGDFVFTLLQNQFKKKKGYGTDDSSALTQFWREHLSAARQDQLEIMRSRDGDKKNNQNFAKILFNSSTDNRGKKLTKETQTRLYKGAWFNRNETQDDYSAQLQAASAWREEDVFFTLEELRSRKIKEKLEAAAKRNTKAGNIFGGVKNKKKPVLAKATLQRLTGSASAGNLTKSQPPTFAMKYAFVRALLQLYRDQLHRNTDNTDDLLHFWDSLKDKERHKMDWSYEDVKSALVAWNDRDQLALRISQCFTKRKGYSTDDVYAMHKFWKSLRPDEREWMGIFSDSEETVLTVLTEYRESVDRRKQYELEVAQRQKQTVETASKPPVAKSHKELIQERARRFKQLSTPRGGSALIQLIKQMRKKFPLDPVLRRMEVQELQLKKLIRGRPEEYEVFDPEEELRILTRRINLDESGDSKPADRASARRDRQSENRRALQDLVERWRIRDQAAQRETEAEEKKQRQETEAHERYIFRRVKRYFNERHKPGFTLQRFLLDSYHQFIERFEEDGERRFPVEGYHSIITQFKVPSQRPNRRFTMQTYHALQSIFKQRYKEDGVLKFRERLRYPLSWKREFFSVLRSRVKTPKGFVRLKRKQIPFWAPSSQRCSVHKISDCPIGCPFQSHNKKILEQSETTVMGQKRVTKKLTRAERQMIWTRRDLTHQKERLLMKLSDVENCTFVPEVGSRSHPDVIELCKENYDNWPEDVYNEKQGNRFEAFVERLGENFAKSHPLLRKVGACRQAEVLFRRGYLKAAYEKLDKLFNIENIKQYFDPEIKKNYLKKKRQLKDNQPVSKDKNVQDALSGGFLSTLSRHRGDDEKAEKREEDFDNPRNAEMLRHVYELVVAIEKQQKVKERRIEEIQDMLRQDAQTKKEQEFFKSRMCPLADKCPRDSRPRWPKSDTSSTRPLGDECPYAHHLMELRFRKGIAGKSKWLAQQVSTLRAQLESTGAGKKWNPTSLLADCPGCGNTYSEQGETRKGGEGGPKGLCGRCVMRQSGDKVKERMTMRKAAALQKMLEKDPQKLERKAREKRIKEAKMSKKLGLFRKAHVLLSAHRLHDAFLCISKAAELVRIEQEKFEDMKEKKERQLRRAQGGGPLVDAIIDASLSSKEELGGANAYLNNQILMLYKDIESSLTAMEKELEAMREKAEEAAEIEDEDSEFEDGERKTEMCPDILEKKKCPRGEECEYAHHPLQLDMVPRRKKTILLQHMIDVVESRIKRDKPPEAWKPSGIAVVLSPKRDVSKDVAYLEEYREWEERNGLADRDGLFAVNKNGDPFFGEGNGRKKFDDFLVKPRERQRGGEGVDSYGGSEMDRFFNRKKEQQQKRHMYEEEEADELFGRNENKGKDKSDSFFGKPKSNDQSNSFFGKDTKSNKNAEANSFFGSSDKRKSDETGFFDSKEKKTGGNGFFDKPDTNSNSKSKGADDFFGGGSKENKNDTSIAKGFFEESSNDRGNKEGGNKTSSAFFGSNEKTSSESKAGSFFDSDTGSKAKSPTSGKATEAKAKSFFDNDASTTKKTEKESTFFGSVSNAPSTKSSSGFFDAPPQSPTKRTETVGSSLGSPSAKKESAFFSGGSDAIRRSSDLKESTSNKTESGFFGAGSGSGSTSSSKQTVQQDVKKKEEAFFGGSSYTGSSTGSGTGSCVSSTKESSFFSGSSSSSTAGSKPASTSSFFSSSSSSVTSTTASKPAAGTDSFFGSRTASSSAVPSSSSTRSTSSFVGTSSGSGSGVGASIASRNNKDADSFFTSSSSSSSSSSSFTSTSRFGTSTASGTSSNNSNSFFGSSTTTTNSTAASTVKPASYGSGVTSNFSSSTSSSSSVAAPVTGSSFFSGSSRAVSAGVGASQVRKPGGMFELSDDSDGDDIEISVPAAKRPTAASGNLSSKSFF